MKFAYVSMCSFKVNNKQLNALRHAYYYLVLVLVVTSLPLTQQHGTIFSNICDFVLLFARMTNFLQKLEKKRYFLLLLHTHTHALVSLIVNISKIKEEEAEGIFSFISMCIFHFHFSSMEVHNIAHNCHVVQCSQYMCTQPKHSTYTQR